MRNNLPMLRPGGTVGPLNPFNVPSALPGIAPMPPLPGMPGTKSHVFVQPAPSSPSGIPSALATPPGAAQQRKTVLPPPVPSQSGGMKLQPLATKKNHNGTASDAKQKSKASTATTQTTTTATTTPTANSSNRSQGTLSPTSSIANGGGIMHRVLHNEKQSSNGNGKVNSPPSPPSGNIPILPAPAKADPSNKILPPPISKPPTVSTLLLPRSSE